jgi:hypothetical protein
LEWAVASPAGSCSICGRHFAEREDYHSALFPSGDTFARKDYCAACWKGPEQATFSFWRTRSREKPAPPKRFVDDEVLLDFFQRLSESEDPARKKFQFIMAVLLMRRRLLKERSRRRDDSGVLWVVEAPRLGKEFVVRDQGFSQAEIAEILGQIGQVLNLELAEDQVQDAQ